MQIERTQKSETKWKILNNKFNSKYENAIFKVTKKTWEIFLIKKFPCIKQRTRNVLLYLNLFVYIWNKACKHIVRKNIFQIQNQSVTIQTIAITNMQTLKYIKNNNKMQVHIGIKNGNKKKTSFKIDKIKKTEKLVQ